MFLKCYKELSNSSLYSLFFLFWICSVFFALSLFLYGFFPMKIVQEDFAVKQDIPTKILNLSVENHLLYPRHVGRFIFVLIDAFRWDFLDFPQHMPYINELRDSKKASILTVRCHPPTATMPRIKALMTGSIPNYIDVVLNLGNNQVKEDNLILQAVENQLKVVFYGDEVWLNLFPDKFMRKEGTTSFFVSDYTEVDRNVTRHIPGEMKRNDWDILILHYLGLDHIGHLAGPTSALVPPKLREMDTVIKNIHWSLQQWDLEHPGEPSFLVVVGDHGMHDSGSHGGATLGEILTSLVLIGNISHNISKSETRPEVEQIDVAATLAVLLGLPIPKLSLGVLIPYALGSLTHEQYLFALFYNAQQVSNQFLQSYADGFSRECFQMYLEAQTLHVSWMESRSEAIRHRAETLYLHATHDMSSQIVKTLVTFNVWTLVIGCFILIQVLLCSLLLWPEKISNFLMKIGVNILATCSVGLAVLLISLAFMRLFSSYFLGDTKNIIVIPLVSLLMGSHWCVILSFCFLSQTERTHLQTNIYLILGMTLPKFSKPSYLLRIGCLLHVVSLCASSLIEEEHQTWYFLWCTLMVFIFISSRQSCSTQIKILTVLFGHRLLCKFNQTGDKWATVPDITDWLKMPENSTFLSSVFLTGLFGVWLCLIWLKCVQDTVTKILHCLSLLCVLQFRAAVGDISLPFMSNPSRGVREVKTFWIACGLIVTISLKKLKDGTFCDALRLLISIWILSCTLLLQPCNIIFISYLVFSSHVILKVFKQPVDRTIAHVWLSSTVFFYQGNSNSLSTIDVAAGYIGAEQQNLISAGFLVVVHTFTFPVLAMLLLWLGLASQVDVCQRKKDIKESLHSSFFLRLLPLTVYCIIIAIQRHHLFIWTVFAPKLLYEVALSTVHLVLIGFCTLLLSLYSHGLQ